MLCSRICHISSANRPDEKFPIQRVQCSQDCEYVFQALEAWLSQGPVIFHPNFAKRFILQTNASEVVLGAVLLQEHDKEEHPVFYLRRKSFPRETKYSTIEKGTGCEMGC
ncbi:unnamed protein product [Lepidochelys kempii]